MQWGAPEFLHGLWAVPVMALFLFSMIRRRELALHRLVHPGALAAAGWRYRAARARVRSIIWLAAMALSVAALARPQWGANWIDVKHQGLDILIVLDTSNSMRAQDIAPSRLERAQLGIQDLVHRLSGERIGLIAFSGGAFLQCPLTIDYGAFLMTLDDVYPGVIPRGGTAIAQALRKALDSFEQDIESDRAIILITDGEDHEGRPLALIDELNRRGIRVYAIGIGSPEGDLIPIRDEQGRLQFMRDTEGNVIKTSLQEDVLERLALRTGGMYVRAAPGDLGMDRIYDQGIARLKREEMESRSVQMHEDRFAWFLGAAFMLLMVEAVMRDRKSEIRNSKSETNGENSKGGKR